MSAGMEILELALAPEAIAHAYHSMPAEERLVVMLLTAFGPEADSIRQSLASIDRQERGRE